MCAISLVPRPRVLLHCMYIVCRSIDFSKWACFLCIRNRHFKAQKQFHDSQGAYISLCYLCTVPQYCKDPVEALTQFTQNFEKR